MGSRPEFVAGTWCRLQRGKKGKVILRRPAREDNEETDTHTHSSPITHERDFWRLFFPGVSVCLSLVRVRARAHTHLVSVPHTQLLAFSSSSPILTETKHVLGSLLSSFYLAVFFCFFFSSQAVCLPTHTQTRTHRYTHAPSLLGPCFLWK